MMNSVRNLLRRETYLTKALKCFEGGILVDPTNSECWYYRGYIMELVGRKKDAEMSYKRCIHKENFENSKLFDRVRKQTQIKII